MMRHLGLLLGSSLILFFFFLGRPGLTDPDETAYGESVREMAENGDWFVPRLYGQPLLDKPILFYWLIGASFRIFGESEFAARLPSAVAAAAGLLAVYRLGWLVHGTRSAGLLSALALATSLEYALLARSAVTDMILTTFCTLAILLYLEVLWNPARRACPLIAAACLGMAVLTKGPVGILVPALVLLAYLAATRSLHQLRQLRPGAGALIFGAVAVPWYLVMAVSHPDLVGQFFLAGNLGRFVRAEHKSGFPVLYYVIVIMGGFLPWSVFLPGAFARALLRWRRGEEDSRRGILPWFWLVSLLALFTLSASKLPSYILPALPAAAILVAGSLARWLEPEAGSRMPSGSFALASLTALGAAASYLAGRRPPSAAIPQAVGAALRPFCIIYGMIALAALGACLLRRSKISLWLLVGGSLALVPCAIWFVYPRVEPWKSCREIAKAVAPGIRPGDGVLQYRATNEPGFAYYLRRIPDRVRHEPELLARLSAAQRFYCLMERHEYERLLRREPPIPLYLLESAGHVVVVSNRPLEGSP